MFTRRVRCESVELENISFSKIYFFPMSNINHNYHSSPNTVAELILNVKHCVYACITLSNDGSVSRHYGIHDKTASAKDLTEVFHRVIKRPFDFDDCLKLKAAIKLYDRVVSFLDRDICFQRMPFVSILTEIDQLARQILLKEPQFYHKGLQEALTSVSSNKAEAQKLLSYLNVNQEFMRTMQEYVDHAILDACYGVERGQLCFSNIPIVAEKNKHSEESSEFELNEVVNLMSELDLGLSLQMLGSITIKDGVFYVDLEKDEEKIFKLISLIKEYKQKPEFKSILFNFISKIYWGHIHNKNKNFFNRLRSRQAEAQNRCNQILADFRLKGLLESEAHMKINHERYGTREEIDAVAEPAKAFEDYILQLIMLQQSIEIHLCFQKEISALYNAAYPVVFDKNQKKTIESLKYQKLLYDKQALIPAPEKFLDPELADPPSSSSTSPAASPHKKGKQKVCQEPGTVTAETPQKIAPKYQLHERVSIWYADPQMALLEERFKDLSHQIKERTKIAKSPPLAALDLLCKEGVSSTWQDKTNKHYSLACEIRQKGERYAQGILAACFNKNEELYHFCFSQKPANEIVQEYAKKRFWDIEFPPLEAARATVLLPKELSGDQSFVSSQVNSFTYQVEDPKNSCIYFLYIPPRSEYST